MTDDERAARIAALRSSRSATNIDRPRRGHAAAKSRLFTAAASTVAAVMIVGGVAAGTNARTHLVGYASAPAGASRPSTKPAAAPSGAPAPPATVAAQVNTTTSGS
jgi:hypothetical protein